MNSNSISTSTLCGILILFLLICFIPIRNAVTKIDYGYDSDNSRDMSNVNNILSGNYFGDPCYPGEYRWYNPLIHYIEAGIVKVTGIPTNVVVSKGGAYLNLLAPVCFFLMMLFLTDGLIAICATAAFLFFTAGNIPGWFSATYTPWLYPLAFIQSFFYLGIIALYQAFRNETLKSSIILGLAIGLAFLGHTAPAVILILQTAWLTVMSISNSIRKKSTTTISLILKNRIVAALFFFIASLPLTAVIIWKYKFKMVNPVIYEYTDELFQLQYISKLIIANLSVSLIIALIGCYHLIRSETNRFVKNIFLSWLTFSVLLYSYVTAAKFLRFHYGILLPGIVPSFHFFFYAKAVESVFFGYGFVQISKVILNYISSKYQRLQVFSKYNYSQLTLGILVFVVIINYPTYLNRGDLTAVPAPANTIDEFDRQKIYQWFLKNTDINQVVLCKEELIAFPLMASGRKMVACTKDHTNPYLRFDERLRDRDQMLEILKGKATDDSILFSKYNVSLFLVLNSDQYGNLIKYFPEKSFTTKTYSIYSRSKN